LMWWSLDGLLAVCHYMNDQIHWLDSKKQKKLRIICFHLGNEFQKAAYAVGIVPVFWLAAKAGLYCRPKNSFRNQMKRTKLFLKPADAADDFAW
jgi:hypothetical protein